MRCLPFLLPSVDIDVALGKFDSSELGLNIYLVLIRLSRDDPAVSFPLLQVMSALLWYIRVSLFLPVFFCCWFGVLCFRSLCFGFH